ELNAADSNGLTALMHAIFWNNFDIMRALLEHDAIDPNARHNSWNALTCAAYNWNVKAVQILLRYRHRGLDINARDRWGKAGIITGAEKGDAQVVKLLWREAGISHEDVIKAWSILQRRGHERNTDE